MANDVLYGFARQYHNSLYILFRLIVGLLFFMHGAQKLFGLFGGQQVVFFSLFGLAGLIETVGGLAVFFGIFVRWAALVAGVEMIIAYFKVHLPQGVNPLSNGGEPVLLFLAAFLVLLAYGPKRRKTK